MPTVAIMQCFSNSKIYYEILLLPLDFAIFIPYFTTLGSCPNRLRHPIVLPTAPTGTQKQETSGLLLIGLNLFSSFLETEIIMELYLPNVLHSALSTQHSALSTQHSALSTQHSAFS